MISHSLVGPSIGEAISISDVTFICLSDHTAVQDILAEAIHRKVEGKLFVDCSTTHSDTANKLTKAGEREGAHFVACSVCGVSTMADTGQRPCLLARPAEQVEKVKAYCQGVLGRAVIDQSGSEPGKAT